MCTHDRELFSFVRLFRKLNNPKLTGIYFEQSIKCDDELYNILVDLWEKIDGNDINGRIEINFENNTYNSHKDLPNKKLIFDKQIQIEATVRKNTLFRFYNSLDDLITSCFKTNELLLPEFYYLIDSDYCHGADVILKRPNALKTIDKIINFSLKLKSIANKVDNRRTPLVSTFYIADTEHNEQVIPFDIEFDITSELQDILIPSFTILEDVIDQAFSKAHSHEKQKILKLSLYEVFKNIPLGTNHIKYLIENWGAIDESYHRHLEIFISGISFSKLKHEIEERSLDFLDSINSSLIDISMKITALPASFGLWIYIIRADHSIIKMWGFCIAILVMTLILFFALDGHVAKFNFVKNSVEKQIKTFKQRLNQNLHNDGLNSDLNQKINETETLLNTRIKKIGLWLNIYKLILWVPALIVFLATLKMEFCP